MQVVKFRAAHGCYNPGEVAGFAAPIAGRLIARGVAESVATEPPRAASKPEAVQPVDALEPAPKPPKGPAKPPKDGPGGVVTK